MIQFPNAKINLGLHVLSKRDDGYHNLETVFYPVALHDALEFVPSKETNCHFYGKPVSGSTTDNLVYKALSLLQQDFPTIPPLSIHLIKHIPMGAGLGGGSSDAAFMLMMLNKYFQLEISKPKLLDYALQLGSDCPFFIENTPCLAKGRGEQLEPITLDLRSYHIILVKPAMHISTAMAFSKINPRADRESLRALLSTPISSWKDQIQNDFEVSLFPLFPELARIKESLYEQGAVYASLSGSGSTLYGIFEPSAHPNLNFSDAEIYQLPAVI